MSGVRVVAMLTCHNRVQRTLECLETLFGQDTADTHLDVVLVDAGSTDGTAEAVARGFPEVQIIARGADLFWCGGMRVAYAHAYAQDPDHYLWLNDDVALDRDALSSLLTTRERLGATGGPPRIVVGSTRDPDTGEPTYGGVVRPDRRRPLSYALVAPTSAAQQVETMNGNCVLVPREVVQRIGTLAAVYTHGMGDYDYGHRAVRAGCEVWVAPGTVGTCARNTARTPATTFVEHRRRAVGPTTGLPPREWATFARRWAGPFWPLYAASPYIRRFARWGLRR